jgi:hypothetical protein
MKLRMKFYNNGDRVVKKGNNPVPYDLLLYVMQLDRIDKLKLQHKCNVSISDITNKPL